VAAEITVAIRGPVTLAEVPRWHQVLLAALEAGQPVQLDLGGSGPWDAAGLQLVLSTITTARRSGVALRLDSLPGVFRAVVEQAGAGTWLGLASS
jgi:ABC-type transporter Mla MlaB component